MKKIISIQFSPKQLDLPPLGGGDTDLLKAKLQQRWPDLMKEILAEKATAAKGGIAKLTADDQDDPGDGPFVDIDQGPDFVDVQPADDAPADDGGDGGDGGGGDRGGGE